MKLKRQSGSFLAKISWSVRFPFNSLVSLRLLPRRQRLPLVVVRALVGVKGVVGALVAVVAVAVVVVVVEAVEAVAR